MTRSLSLLALFLAPALFFAPAVVAQPNGAPVVECSDEQNVKAQYYSLYYESYRAEDYANALPNLEWILECAPAFGLTPGDRNIRRGIEIFEALAVASDDPAQQRDYFARALALFDEGPSILQDAGVEVSEFDWVVRKGRFIQNHPELLAEQQDEVYDLYVRAFEMQPDSLGDYYINYIAGESTRRAATENTPEAKAAAREYLTGTLQPHADDPAYITGLLDNLITTPREQYEYLVGRFRADPSALSDEDLNTLYGMQRIEELEAQNPDLNDLLVAELLERDPTPALLRSLGGAAMSAGNYAEAQSFYERALGLTEDPTDRRDLNYSLGVLKQQQGQRATAANYARAALEIDGQHAESLYLLGSLVQASLGGGDARARAGYWCAVDFYNRAANAANAKGNAALAADARRAAGNAGRGAPTSEDYFFLGWQPGQTITASYGWGSCSTTVR